MSCSTAGRFILDLRDRVLFIGGWGRSGSTLLDRILGQVPGVFSAGELREIWDAGCLKNRPCGCGEPFLTCPFWSHVGKVAFGGWDTLDLRAILKLRYSLDRPWMVPLLSVSTRDLPMTTDRVRYVDILRHLYRAIMEVSGADVIVDSSKIPSHAYLLRTIPEIDLRILHLIRDSRGVAYSWQKLVQRPGESHADYMHRYGPVASSMRWLLYNGQTTALRHLGVPYRRLRYEDLMAEPRRRSGEILDFAGLAERVDDLPFAESHVVAFGSNHSVDGNPIRFSTGPTQLRVDDDWRSGLHPRRRATVTVLTFPGLWRYGYLRAARGRS